MFNSYYIVKFLFDTKELEEPYESKETRIKLNKLVILDNSGISGMQEEAGLRVLEFINENYDAFFTKYSDTEFEGLIHARSEDPNIHNEPLKFMASEIEMEQIVSLDNVETRELIAKTLGHMARTNTLDEAVKLNAFLDIRDFGSNSFRAISAKDFVDEFLDENQNYPGHEEVNKKYNNLYELSYSCELTFKVLVEAENEDEAQRYADDIAYEFSADVDCWESDVEISEVEVNDYDLDMYNIECIEEKVSEVEE